MPELTPPVQFRKFGDAPATRQLIFDNVLATARGLAPLTNQRHTLQLADVAYEGPERYSKRDVKQAVITGGSLSRRLRGTWQLTDNATGQSLGEKRTTLANVPYLTDDGVFLKRGVAYGLANQLRLSPGVYTREQSNGGLEAHVNVLPGKGRGHKLAMDPETGIFKLNIGQASMPLYPLLRAMGATDATLREQWGNTIAGDNAAKNDSQVIPKLYERVVRNRQPGIDAGQMSQAVADAFNGMELDDLVTQRTLGRGTKKLDLDTILAVTKKLIALNSKTADPDDRDHLAYQRIMGPEELIAERLARSQPELRRLFWGVSARQNLDRVGPGFFDKALDAALIGSGLGSPLEEINPAEIFDQQSRITRMGEGGITSSEAVPEESRTVQPSHLGFIDFLRTPECYDRETEVMTWAGWKRWPDVRPEDELACLVDGRLEFNRPTALHCYPYAGTLYGADTGRIAYLVTPNHRLWTRPRYQGSQFRYDFAEDLVTARNVLSAGFSPMLGDPDKTFRLPKPEYSANPQQVAKSNNIKLVDTVAMVDWAELVGWYLGEGSCTYKQSTGRGNPQYRIKITQSTTANADNCRRIRSLLSRLPFQWSYSDRAFCIATKQVAEYFRQFGGSAERWIPEYLLRASQPARRRLFEALLLGEGRRDRANVRSAFCTTSRRLADDFIRLAFSLGRATTLSWEPDARPQSNHGGAWIVWVHKTNEHQINPRRCPSHGGGSDIYTRPYVGNVYCATVPGSLLYVRRGNTVGHWSGNSGKVGVDMRLARGAVKGSDGRIYTQVQDAKTGEVVYKSAQDLADSVIAFTPTNTQAQPDGPQPPARKFWGGGGLRTEPVTHGQNTYVRTISGGKMRYERADKVDYVLPHFENTFSSLANMIPLKSMVKGQRAVMASRMLTQALPLVDAEAPLVQSGMPDQPDRSFEEEYATHMGAIRAEQPARVVSVSDDEIVVQHQDGTRKTHELSNHMPYNRKTFLHQTATVRPGDVVQPGQLLARSNYTDDAGTTSLGKNLSVGYLPFRGMNFEDAVVISESAANKLSSEHAYQHDVDWDDKVHRGKNAFVSIFPGTYNRQQLERFDDDGVIKPGTEVRFGDPLVLVARERERTYGALHRGRGPAFVDDTITWKHHAPGVVTDAAGTDRGVSVVVRSTAASEVGDKLSGRYGDKGVIAAIIPDDEMPTNRSGSPFEILVNPLGIITRTNPAQLIEAALGKVAAKTGQPYKLKDFDRTRDIVNYALGELKKNGLTDTEDVIDAATGRKIPNVFTGNRWFMKLHHTAESKGQGRGIGGYTAEGAPAKGGETGAKRIGLLNLGALLSHGAGKVIREAKLIRGQANPEYWSQFMSGFRPTTPQVSPQYHKFVNQLRAAAINPLRVGTQTHLMAMRDGDVDTLAGDRELQNVQTVKWDGSMKPVPGGLFDEKLTGGHDGTSWSKITFVEPLPSPVMEDPICRVLGLTQDKFRDVLAGRAELNGYSGPQAISHALKGVNVERELAEAREHIRSSRGVKRDRAVRVFGLLKDAQRQGIHPADWMLRAAPVLPPKFRPVATMGAKKLPLVADANYLYKELFEANQSLKQLQDQVDDVADERLGLYDAFKAVVGLGSPTQPKNVERNVKGVLKQIFGSSPKFGTVQRKLLSMTTDLVGRATITPNPDLDMDQVGIPEEKAWSLYSPFIIRNLVRRGLPRMQAAQLVEDRSQAAREAMVHEMTQRPVMIDRAPVLHRYGVMAFWPQLTKGHTLQISPLVVGGFNADFDGDAMQFHVPGDDDAAQEMAEKMLPSRNLLSAATFKTNWRPTQEYVGGLYAATARINKLNKAKVFATIADALRAYHRDGLDLDQQIHVMS